MVEVLDNSSDAEFRELAVQVIKEWPINDFFRVVYMGLRDNRGFGAGHNTTIAQLNSEFHLVLNPDAELADDALSVGLSSLQEDPSIVLLSPKVQGEDGAQEFLCKRYPSLFVLLLRPFAPRLIRRIFRKRLHRYEMRDVCSGNREADILLASGCFMLVRTAALQSVGGFNDKYFLYFEDFDLSIRLGSQGRLVFNPAIQIVHHGGYAAQKGLQHMKYFIRRVHCGILCSILFLQIYIFVPSAPLKKRECIGHCTTFNQFMEPRWWAPQKKRCAYIGGVWGGSSPIEACPCALALPRGTR